MQTVLNVNDKLFQEAANLLAVQNPNQLIGIALTELIKNHQIKKRDVRELVGKIKIDPDYDYKKLRCGAL